MKKYHINKVEQNGKVFFSLVADPRLIVKMIPDIKPNEVQEFQRPWNETRVKEIAHYVAGKFKEDGNRKSIGLIPNAPILNIKKTILVEKDATGYYINLPENDAEMENFADSIEVIDGQHRIRAFMKEYILVDFPEDRKYDMVFTLFDKMSENEKREIFMITNEKQQKVPGNLLRLFKKILGLLKSDEIVYDLVSYLNKEDFSPLKGRIKMGAQRITKGYQEGQVSKILNKSDTYKVLDAYKLPNGDKIDIETMAKIISNYLIAWERAYEVKYDNPGKETITKISGLRYILYLFPACFEILENRQKSATADEFKKIISLLPAATEIENVFTSEITVLSFRGEGATTQMAKDHAMKLTRYERGHRNNYDISEGI